MFSLTYFFLVKKKEENKHITVLKYCLTYSISLCSVCAQDWAELTSVSFLLRVRMGEPASVLSSMCLPASVPLLPPLPHPLFLCFCLPWKAARLMKHIQEKNSPRPAHPAVSLCPCVPLPTNKEVWVSVSFVNNFICNIIQKAWLTFNKKCSKLYCFISDYAAVSEWQNEAVWWWWWWWRLSP